MFHIPQYDNPTFRMKNIAAMQQIFLPHHEMPYCIRKNAPAPGPRVETARSTRANEGDRASTLRWSRPHEMLLLKATRKPPTDEELP
jgi:hypothetical protein